MAPDFDFILYLFTGNLSLHRPITHYLWIGIFLLVVALFLYKVYRRFAFALAVFAGGYLSHVIMDRYFDLHLTSELNHAMASGVLVTLWIIYEIAESSHEIGKI